MPYVSDEQVDWANRVLRDGSMAARKAMLTSNAVLPPAGGIDLSAIGHAGEKFDDVVKQDFTKLKIGAAADSIAFIKLRANAKNEIGAMTFSLKRPRDLPTVASRAGWTPIWWLPWQSGHIVKIKIRSAATDRQIDCGPGVDPVDNPSVFFTAAINGCSVFAVGDNAAPSLYHGGINGSMSERRAGELTEDAWRRLLGRVGTTKNVQGIGKTDYISELNPTRRDDDDRTRFSTTAARQFEQQLLANGQLTNVAVDPWGMVFGLRDIGHDWSMTLVRNAVVRYRRVHVTSKKRLFGAPKTVRTVVGEQRAARRYDADGNVTVDLKTAEQEITYCYTMGWQDFFPGVGNARLHDMSRITLF